MTTNPKPWVMLLSVLCLLVSCQSTDSSQANVSVIWTLEKNIPLEDGGTTHYASFQIISDDAELLNGTDWGLFWNQSPRKPLGILNGKNVEITHINGDFYSMLPKANFVPDEDGNLTVRYEGDYAMIKESDAPLGVYMTKKTKVGKDQIIKLKDYQITPFTEPEQVVRAANDKQEMVTPEYLFIQNAGLPSVSPEDFTNIIPEPMKSQTFEGSFILSNDSGITGAENLSNEIAFLMNGLQKTGLTLQEASNGAIQLSIDPGIENPEGYRLNVTGNDIKINGGSNAGVFYGVQSLLALVKEAEGTDNQVTISNVKIEDYPAFPYRGMHLDVGRNFQTKEQILKMLDLMAMYKLNKFLFYLTEDEGWRLEIKGFPELTEVSARRGHTLDEHDFLQPAYGSGPDPTDPTSYGNGYYTREDYIEILHYAQERHIDVIPEVNFPGHARTAILAMENRYRRLMEEGKQAEAEKYRLIDPDDESVYESPQGYNDNIVCVCKEAPYLFYEEVLDDIISIYEEADVPLTMMHTGGDEVPVGAWSASPLCAELRKSLGEDEDSRNLQAYFFRRLIDIIESKGLPSGAWEEAIMRFAKDGSWTTRTDFVNKSVYPYIWQNLWGNQDLGYKMANLGYPIILCNVTNFYFDLAYDKDPREPGLYWGGFNNSKHAFDFVPYDLFKSTVENNMGQRFDVENDFKDKERLNEKGSLNIIGLQSQLWSETIKGGAMLEHYTLPKMLGFAERAWRGQEDWMNVNNESVRTEANTKAWSRFIHSAVANEFDRLDKRNEGYMYRIPAPGILVEDGGVRLNTAYPGMQIRYTTDGSTPTMDSPLYEGGLIPVEGSTIKAMCFNNLGRSGLVSESSLKQFEL